MPIVVVFTLGSRDADHQSMEALKMKKNSALGLIVFDHDGTLVDTGARDFKLFKGIKELLVDLTHAGFELAVWTARSRRSTIESLKSLDIASFFGEIYGHDDGMPKPHPEGLKQVSEGFEKENVIHIGDSIGDLEGAKSFGISVIAACWSQPNQVENFRQKTPLIAMTPDECRGIIATKFNVML